MGLVVTTVEASKLPELKEDLVHIIWVANPFANSSLSVNVMTCALRPFYRPQIQSESTKSSSRSLHQVLQMDWHRPVFCFCVVSKVGMSLIVTSAETSKLPELKEDLSLVICVANPLQIFRYLLT